MYIHIHLESLSERKREREIKRRMKDSELTVKETVRDKEKLRRKCDTAKEKSKESSMLLLYLLCMVEEQVQYADFILP